MKLYILTIALCMTLGIAGCYDEETVTSERGEPKYEITDSDDVIEHERYLLWKNTGVYLLYNYDDVDYKWNIAGISTNILFPVTDRKVLEMSMNYITTTLTGYYNDAFMRKYFPIKILLSQRIDHESYGVDPYVDRIAASGRNYLAIGLQRTDTLATVMNNNELMLRCRGDIQGKLWADIIYDNGLIAFPNQFFAISEELYGVSLEADKDNRDKEGYVQGLGFWEYDQTYIGTDYMLPSRNKDIYDFISRMTSMTEDEIEALMTKSEKLRTKYTILREYIKSTTGIDLQEIGNQNGLVSNEQ
ncbi:MAG: putative zinc-binding metallopeptidase [Marinifilaceae bacterium]